MLRYQNENIGKSYSFRRGNYKNGYAVALHIHEYSELLYVEEGCMTMTLDGETVSVPAGHIVFIFPNQSHEYTSRTMCNVWCFVFSNDYLHSFFRTYSNCVPRPSIIKTDENMKYILELMQTEDCDNAVAITGVLNLLFANLIKKVEFVYKRGDSKSLYNRAINYISANYKNDFTLSDMARALGYHEKYLSSELHELTNMNFRTFLSTYRTDHAKKLLTTTHDSISEIALDSGFSSINTFNRVFKETVGMTPSEYRKSRGM